MRILEITYNLFFVAAKANGDSITVIWSPPKNPNIMVRDYIIGWGKGVPDDFAERLEGKFRFYVIKNLGN